MSDRAITAVFYRGYHLTAQERGQPCRIGVVAAILAAVEGGILPPGKDYLVLIGS